MIFHDFKPRKWLSAMVHIHNYHVIINFKRIELNSYVERIDECLILEETAIARLASGMNVEL